MSSQSEHPNTNRQPALADLLRQYLQDQASAQQAGLAYADTTGDVIPHEAVAAQPVDPRLAWEGACTALHYLVPEHALGPMTAPADWPALVAEQEPVTALPFCLGNFPQQVRDLTGLFHAIPLNAPVRSSHPSSAPAGLLAWAEKASWQKGHPNPLLAAAALRLSGEYDRTAELLNQHHKALPKAWESAWANEAAALAWNRGDQKEAVRLWGQQPDSVPVLFNRGLAALVAGRNKDARTYLSKAVAELPEIDAWHHLGQLYLALADLGG